MRLQLAPGAQETAHAFDISAQLVTWVAQKVAFDIRRQLVAPGAQRPAQARDTSKELVPVDAGRQVDAINGAPFVLGHDARRRLSGVTLAGGGVTIERRRLAHLVSAVRSSSS